MTQAQAMNRNEKRATLITELVAAINLIDGAYSGVSHTTGKPLSTEDVMTLSDLRVKCDTMHAALGEIGTLDDAALAPFDEFVANGFELTSAIRREVTSNIQIQ